MVYRRNRNRIVLPHSPTKNNQPTLLPPKNERATHKRPEPPRPAEHVAPDDLAQRPARAARDLEQVPAPVEPDRPHAAQAVSGEGQALAIARANVDPNHLGRREERKAAMMDQGWGKGGWLG